MSGWPWSGYIHQSSNRIYDKSLQQESARPAAKQTQFARHILTSSSSSYAVRREKIKLNLTKLGIGSKMFPQFGATAETLSKASTMVFRIGTDAHLYDDPEDVNIAPLLDSKFDSEKCEALKRLLALIAQGFDVSNFFPQVALLIYAFSSVWLLRNKKKRSYDSENYNYSLVLS